MNELLEIKSNFFFLFEIVDNGSLIKTETDFLEIHVSNGLEFRCNHAGAISS